MAIKRSSAFADLGSVDIETVEQVSFQLDLLDLAANLGCDDSPDFPVTPTDLAQIKRTLRVIAARTKNE